MPALIQVSWEVALWGHLATSEVALTSSLSLAAMPPVALLWVGLRVPRAARLGVSWHPVAHNLSLPPAGPCAQGVHEGSLTAVQVLVPREAKSRLAPEISVSLGETLGHNVRTSPLPSLASPHSPLPRVASAWVGTESRAWRRARQVLRLSTGPFAGPEGGHWACPAPAPAQQAAVSSVLSFRYPEYSVACPRACRQNDHFIPCIKS